MDTPEHPSDIDLELVRTGQGDADIAQHVESCEACREQLVWLDGLAATLTLPETAPPAFAAGTDEAIRDMIAQRAAEIREPRPVLTFPYWRVVATAAAAAIVVLGIWLPNREPNAVTPPPPVTAHVMRGDVNGDGAVDIIDAYLVASKSPDAAPAPDAWDMNADGVVDAEDANAIANAAVAINTEEGT